jgi:hypothetical protein
VTERQTVRKTASSVADRDEILSLLSDAARKGHVGAMRLLLEEHRRADEPTEAPSVIDELSKKRKKAAGGG